MDHISSTKIITSDKYEFWGRDAIGVTLGFISLLWGIGNCSFPGTWRLIMIISGVFLLSVCSIRIERIYIKFKNEILRKIELLES